jgi:hypothetical protein
MGAECLILLYFCTALIVTVYFCTALIVCSICHGHGKNLGFILKFDLRLQGNSQESLQSPDGSSNRLVCGLWAPLLLL